MQKHINKATIQYLAATAMMSGVGDAGYYDRKDNNKHSKVGKKQCKSCEHFTKLKPYHTECSISSRWPKPTDVACAYYEKRNKKRK